MAGLTAVEKQIILLKLTNLYENRPDTQYQIGAGTPEREWFSEVAALVKTYDSSHYGTQISASMMFLNSRNNASDIVGIVSDVLAAIKLELELDGRSDIGTVYKPGEVYQFYADFKDIIAGAEKEILLVDAYLTGQAFDEYFGSVRAVGLRLLTKQYGAEIKTYADRHTQQFQTSIEVRKAKGDDVSDLKLLQKEFWEGLRSLGASLSSKVTFGRAPRAQHWYDVSIGTSRCHLALTINSQKKYVACEVYIRDDLALYATFLENRTSIETAVGSELEWMELPTATASRIKLALSCDPKNKENWLDYHQWLVTTVEKFSSAFTPHV